MRPKLAITLLTAALAAGCQTQQGPVVANEEGPGPGVRVDSPYMPYATIRWNTVNFLDTSMQQGGASKVAVEDTNADLTNTGTIRAYALVRNRSTYPLQLEGRTHFFDREKRPLESPTAWQRMFLPPNGIASYESLSTSRVGEVGYYYIEMREGR